MREIKFRAWDKAEKRMWNGWNLDGSMSEDGSCIGGYFGELDFPFPDTPEGEPREGWNFQTLDQVELMQFTGLKDKNGVEIYESDEMGEGNVVEMCNGCWCINGDVPLSVWANNHEVTGNIYES